MKLVYIEWVDSHSGQGWKSLDRLDEECEPLPIRTVGWLISDKNDCKCVAHSIYDERKNERLHIEATGDIVIPKSAIRKFRVLKAPDTGR